METAKSLLLNFFFIICPIFIYLFFIVKRGNLEFNGRHRFSTIAFGAVSILLCMSFPVTFSTGFLLDLRMIPAILCSLMGRVQAISLYVCIISYRWILGGDGFYASLFASTILLFVILLIMKQFQAAAPRRRIQITLWLSTLSVILPSMATYFLMDGMPLSEYLKLILQLGLIQTFCMYVSVKIIEMFYRNWQLTEQLHRSEKMQVVGNLAASVSHEIRNPLTVAKGFIQLMKENESDSDKNHRFQLILEELNRAEEILTDFLRMAKPGTECFVLFSVHDEVSRVIERIHPYATAHGVTTTLSCEVESSVLISGDPSKFQQCLINLLNNGVESMPLGGELLVHIQNLPNDEVEIFIQDNGIGMTCEEIKRLGVPFYSTRAKGTGLGTMVAFHIVEAMNGILKIESKKGKGTKIMLCFPSSQRGS